MTKTTPPLTERLRDGTNGNLRRSHTTDSHCIFTSLSTQEQHEEATTRSGKVHWEKHVTSL